MSQNNVLEPIEAQRTGPQGHLVANNLLLSLPDHEFEQARPALEFLDLPDHLKLHEPGQNVQYAYFPNRGMISLVVVTEDGRTVEVGVVGREGFAGAALAVGLRTSSVREVVQIAGDGFRIGASAVEGLMRDAPEMRLTMGRYAVVLGMQISQTAACNRLHSIEQRLARWLLVTRDRVESAIPADHARFPGHHAGDRPADREPGGQHHAEEGHPGVQARRGEDPGSPETAGMRLRVLSRDRAIQSRAGPAIISARMFDVRQTAHSLSI